MNTIIIFSICFIIFHAIYNLINYLRYNSIQTLFFGLYSDDSETRTKSLSLKNIIVNYIKYAGVNDKHIVVSQPIGYYQVANSTVSVLDNIINNRQDIASSAYELLLEAKGNYWSRFINSINPFYWIRVVIFIPKYIFSYLGLKPDSLIIKIFQLIYWLIAIVFTLLTSVFTDEVKSFIMSFIQTH